MLSGGPRSLAAAEAAREAGALAACVFVDFGHSSQVADGWRAFAFCGEHGIPLRAVHVFGLHAVSPTVIEAVGDEVARELGADSVALGTTT